MRKLIIAVSLLAVAIGIWITTGGERGQSVGQNITLMVWHTYVEQMSDSFDALVKEFNDTEGAQHSIVVKVATEANSSTLNEMIIAAAKRDPGAPAAPDIAVIYPKIAVELAEMGMLADIRDYFTADELARFVPQFLEEGMLGRENLYLLPIAKSTEVLFVNRTIFDRFAAATGIALASLATFEGIADAADKYYEWTDSLTPEIPNDGRAFYYPDIPFNFAAVGFEQLGDIFVKGGSLNLASPVFERIWDFYLPRASMGEFAIFDKYANYLAMTGDIVCATSTSAGAMFYPETVIYADNTKEPASFDVLPYPVFEGGKRVAAQRGGGLCVMKTGENRERAAALFLKWLTAPAQNLRFTVSTGYMPVTVEAFDLVLTGKLDGVSNERVRAALAVAAEMQKTYRFYVPPVFSGFDELQNKYVALLLKSAGEASVENKKTLRSLDMTRSLEETSRSALRRFREVF
ncbi:MAG: extracellular solute-binding protein [Synergistaceae bacterium]|jgi:multiple sugar transport system substrate-binding protein|nr:extracellular solute-binding protein [Synergistaceae bacterium]